MGQPIKLVDETSGKSLRRPDRLYLAAIAFLALISPYTLMSFSIFKSTPKMEIPVPHVAKDFKHSVLKCKRLHLLPSPPSDFASRIVSDRFVEVSFVEERKASIRQLNFFISTTGYSSCIDKECEYLDRR